MAGEILHWNINGLKCKRSPNYKAKLDRIKSFLDNEKTLVLNIQETHISRETELPKFLDYYKHLYHFEKTYARSDDTASGILMCIRKTENMRSFEVIEEGRLIHIQIQNKASNEIFNIFSIYCNSSCSEEKKTLLAKLDTAITNKQLDNQDIMVLGDFNFVTNNLDRNNHTLNRVDQQTTNAWTNLENKLNLQDTFRITNLKRRIYSYVLNSNKKNQIID